MAKERFEDILEKLDSTVDRLESGDQPLEESFKIFKQGVDLVKKGNARLGEMEQKVELLLKDVGSEQTVDFEIEEDPED